MAVAFYNMGGCGLHVFAYKGFEKGNGAREPHLLIPAYVPAPTGGSLEGRDERAIPQLRLHEAT